MSRTSEPPDLDHLRAEILRLEGEEQRLEGELRVAARRIALERAATGVVARRLGPVEWSVVTFILALLMGVVTRCRS